MKNRWLIFGSICLWFGGFFIGISYERNRDLGIVIDCPEIVDDCTETEVSILIPGFEVKEEYGKWQEVFNEGNKALVQAEDGTVYFYEYDGEIWQPLFSSEISKYNIEDK